MLPKRLLYGNSAFVKFYHFCCFYEPISRVLCQAGYWRGPADGAFAVDFAMFFLSQYALLQKQRPRSNAAKHLLAL
jgi:hypothetical protein